MRSQRWRPARPPQGQDSKLKPSPSELESRSIKDARRRQRAGLRLSAPALFAGLVVVTIGFSSGGHTTRPTGSSKPRASVNTITSPAAVFAEAPYMGVSCHLPNSIACDRVGLAVWLWRPATVSATIAGAPLKLNDPHWSYVARDAAGSYTSMRASCSQRA